MRQGVLSGWHDRMIPAGTEWGDEIDSHLESSQLILLLVSSDFLASDYCYDKEMKRALEKHEEGSAKVIPIVLRSVDWEGAPFGKLQALPKDAKPVLSWDNQDEAFTNITQGIRNSVKDIANNKPKAKSQNIQETLRCFELRPKKYAGQEIVATIELENGMYRIDSEDAECFRLNLGDAISRVFTMKPYIIYEKSLFAEGKMADWLEGASSGEHTVRLKFLFGTYEKEIFGAESRTESNTGFKLIEILDEENGPNKANSADAPKARG